MNERVDENGAAFAGSQLQTQLYVNRRAEDLNASLYETFPDLVGRTIEWRSPLVGDRYAEYWDRGFLECVGLGHHAAELKAFWPTGGPHWDALAVVHTPDSERPGVVLAEGKSYPGELYGSGCQAQPGSMSRALIEKSLAWTQQRLGVTTRSAQEWCGPLYQNANRLAHLAWLDSLGVRAWLAHLLFVDDPIGPTDAAAWETALALADRDLGLDAVSVPSAGHVLLPARSRDELFAP